MTGWQYANAEGTVVFRNNLDGSIDSRSIADCEVVLWITSGNKPLPKTEPYQTVSLPTAGAVKDFS